MRGHIQQRGKNSWRIEVYVGRDVSDTKREAERELSRLLVEVDEGRHVASPSMTLDSNHFVASVLIDGGIPISTVSQAARPQPDVDDAEHLHPRHAQRPRHERSWRAHICRFPYGNLRDGRPGGGGGR